MSATHWFMIVVMLGVHYPVAWLYTHWTLKGLPETERLDIMRSVRSRLRLLLVIWIVVLSTVGVALLVSSSLERALYVISYSTIVGFHLIWWPFVVPVFRAVEKELKNRGIERTSENVAPVRTAQLRPRRASDYLAPWMTYLPIAVVISGLGVVAWRLATYSPGEARVWILSITFAVSGLLFWILWSLWVRREIAVSYPAGDAEDSASRQIAAAEAVCRFRVLGV